jgi:hypothetical protein
MKSTLMAQSKERQRKKNHPRTPKIWSSPKKLRSQRSQKRMKKRKTQRKRTQMKLQSRVS